MTESTYCPTSDKLRNNEADARAIMQGEQRQAEFWHKRLKQALAARLRHEASCTCGKANRTSSRGDS